MGDSQYSFSLTTFSPSGKLVQIEHALTAVGAGQTSLGIKDLLYIAKNVENLHQGNVMFVLGLSRAQRERIFHFTKKKNNQGKVKEIPYGHAKIQLGRAIVWVLSGARDFRSQFQVWSVSLCRGGCQMVLRTSPSVELLAANGVIIATEKKLPSILVDETSVQKMQLMTTNIGVVYSGMGPDSRVLVRKSRKQAQQYYRLYKEPIPVTQLVRETAAVMQEFTQSGGVRPFGVSLLIAGYDDNGPQLFQVDPSGSYFSWKASAMGKNVSNAKTFLEKRYTDDMELDDAVHTAILTLKEGFEGQISGKNIEIGIIGSDRKFRVLTPAEIDDYLAEVE